MDISKKSIKWKHFDFGPQIKINSSSNEVVREKKVSKVINTRNTAKSALKSFNFFEKLTPTSINDLAVHPKKIQEVENWLSQNTLQHQKEKSTPFLLLSGPTGSGKTTTVYVLCKKLNISLSEWVNPIDQDYEYKEMNQIQQFVEFLSESKYSSLFESSNKRVTLIKDFPNALIRNPQQFFEVLEGCKYTTNQPVIFICTETSSFTLNFQKTFFPDDIIQKFNISHISFNASAPSLMKIAVRRAQELVKLNSDLFKQPSTKTIEAILASTTGDIRNAMNQFYVASLLGTNELPTEKTKYDKKTSKRKREMVDTARCSFMVKDQNLGLFHGLGRVLNPKKTNVGNSWRFSHNIESLVDEFSTQPHVFTSFLFENYLKYFGHLTDVMKSAEVLSLSTTFLENWERHETLIFALWISVLGLMIFNEHKVSRWTQINGPVKIDTNRCGKDLNTIGLDATDYFYYNIINKSDKFYKFKLDF